MTETCQDRPQDFNSREPENDHYRTERNQRNDTMSALDLLNITQLAREKLNLHHEAEILKGLMPDSKIDADDHPQAAILDNHVDQPVTRFRPQKSVKAKRDQREPHYQGSTTLPVKKVSDTKNPKISHYQSLSDALANWIFMNSKEKIIAATIKGHGWTNIFQYLPTNHPDGIAQIMPILSAAKSQLWSSIPKGIQEDLLKYFAGIDVHGMPIKSTKENDGVPLILLIQGPKIGASRSLDCLRAQGLNTVMDQLKAKFNELYPGVTIVHRWVGKNGYIMEAVWDQEGYQNRLDMRSLFKNA